MKILFYILFFLNSLPLLAATELYLDSPLINLSLPEIELNDPEIYYGDPCANIQNASSCVNDAPNKTVIVRFPLNVTSNIPSGRQAQLNYSFLDENSTPFAEVELLQSESVMTPPLEFSTNTSVNYQIQFKIKYQGINSHSEPKVRIRFTLVEVLI